MTTEVKFTCDDCGAQVVVGIDVIRLDLDPTDPDAVIVARTCPQGHATEQRLHLTNDGPVIEALITACAHTPTPCSIQAYLDAVPDIAAWLDSPAFDADRAALRLTGGAP